MALLDDLRREVRQRGERIARTAAIQMQAELRRTGPEITGQLNKKTTVRVTGVGDTITTEAIVDVPYAQPVILGARPHTITAKKPGGKLRFYWPKVGTVVYFRSVSHPGNKPNPYFKDQINRWGDLLQAAANRLR